MHFDDFQSGEGELARTLISHHYGSGSIPRFGDTCRLRLLLALFLASWVSLRNLPFCSSAPPQRPTFSFFFFFFFYLSREKDQLGESQYESVNQVEAAKLLGSPNSKNNTRLQPPPENCEYAVVNKANKKVRI